MDELQAICVPSKLVQLEVTPTEKIELCLKPFKQRHFAQAIEIVNKYFDRFNLVRQSYIDQRKAILDKYEDKITRDLALEELDAGFNEGLEIAKAMLNAGGSTVATDIKAIILFSISKTTKIEKRQSSTERSPIEIEIDDLTWGECLILLASAIGLNLDFFNQNLERLDLIKEALEEPAPQKKPKGGAKLSRA